MYLFHLLIVVIISGCAATEVNRIQATSEPLRPDSSFYVLQSADGLHDGHRQVSSGLITSQRVASEFKAHARHVETGTYEEDLQAGLVSAKKRNANYLVSPSILEWENDATPMASVPDKIKVRIDVVDVATENIVDTVVLQNQMSKMAVSKTPPQELLVTPLKEYVEALIQSESHQSESEQVFWRKLQFWASN